MQTKEQIRQQMRLLLLAQTRDERKKKSLFITDKVIKLEAFGKARCICFFVSMVEEFDTSLLLDLAWQNGKCVVVPKTDLAKKTLDFYQIASRADLRPGVLGILEPAIEKAKKVSADVIDCVIVPGLAFDEEGYRLGRGGGFYDRFLEKLPAGVPRIGVGFSFQKVDQLPREAHDQKINFVITD